MDEKEMASLIRAIHQSLGDPLKADSHELEALFAEFGEGKNPAQSVFELAYEAAREYRLEGKAVPDHVAAALNSSKRLLSGEDPEMTNPNRIIDAVLNPFSGPVLEVSYAFRNRKECTVKDNELLERLSGELKKDWSKEE